MKKLSKALLGVLLVCALAIGFVACGGGTDTSEAVIDSVSVSKKPTKVEYWVGDTFDPTGMELTVKYKDNKKDPEKITEGFTVDKTAPLTVADKQVKVTYKEKTATLNITVKEDSMAFVLKALPAKLDYTSDKKVDLNGIKASVVSAKDGEKEVAESDLTATLDGDVVTVKYGDMSAFYTVKTQDIAVANIGSQTWYGTTNEANLFGKWDLKDADATLPTVDADKGTVTFTDKTWARLPVFCVKYPKNDGTVYEQGNNIGAEVNDHVDNQTFNYSLQVNATGSFRMGFLLANSALQDLTEVNSMGIMLHFDGTKMTLATTEGGGTQSVLAQTITNFENNKDNRIDFSFMRKEHKVTFIVYVNGIRAYWSDVNVSAHANAALEEGNFTFKAGRYNNEESDKTETGFKNYGNRLGIYAETGTTVVLSDVK